MVVLQSLLAPPPAPKYEIYRKVVNRSLRWLQRQPAAVVALLAPAGYGKTSYLRQLHLEMRAAGHPTVWLSLRGMDFDEDSLLMHIVEALRSAGVAMDEACEKNRPPGLSILHVQSAIERSNACVTLFLDDLDTLRPELAGIVERLLSLEHDNLRVAFSARRTPRIRLGRIQSSGRFQRIAQADLLFSFADMHELFRKRVVNVPDVFLVGSQYRMTEGWPALVQLLAQSHLSRLPALPGPGMAHANGDLATYLKEEILAGCDEDELQLLGLVALVESIDPQNISRIFSPSEYPARISDIVAANPIFGRSSNGVEITINPVLADLVRSEMAISNLVRFQRLSAELAGWHEHNGEPDCAIDHFINAGEFDRAIMLLGREGRRVTLDGMPDRCISWVERLPCQIDDPDPGLLMAEAWARIAMYDLTRGAELVHRVRELSADGGNFGTDLELCLADAFRYAMMDDFETAYQVIRSGFGVQKNLTSPFIHAGHSNFCAWHSISNGRFDEGRAELYRAACIGPEMQGHLAWAYGTLGIAESFSLEGDMAAADNEYRRIVAVAEARRGYSSAVAASAVGPWLDVMYEMNRIDEIHSLLIGRLDLVFRACLPGGLASGASAVAKALFFSGSENDAVALLRRLEDVGTDRSLIRLRAASLATQIWIALKQRKEGQVRLLLDRLLAMTDEINGLGGSGQGTVNFFGMISRCRVAARLDPDSTIHELEGQLRLLQKTPWRRNQLAVMSLLASVAWKCGDAGRAVEVLAQSLEIAAPLQIKRTIVDDIHDRALMESPALRQALCPAANRLREELVGMIDGISDTLEARPAGTEPERREPYTIAAQAELSTFTGREREVLFLIERGLPVKHIARALAVSPDTAKFHLKNIYQKLSVHDRVAACDAIRKMQLFERSVDSFISAS